MWLAAHTGEIKQSLHCDWLTVQSRWNLDLTKCQGTGKIGLLNRGLVISRFLFTYCIFSSKHPRHLFQTWPGGPSVYLKPAFNLGQAFINKVFFFSAHDFIKLIYYNPTSEAQGKLGKTG